MPPLLDTAAALARLVASAKGERRLIGMAGPPGAGKSTLAQAVVDAIEGAVLVPMDGFHLAQSVVDAAGLADRKGAPETFDRAGYAALLVRLRDQRPDQGPVYAPEFRRRIEEPIAGAIQVRPDAALVVTEGNYLLHWPEVRALLDEVWWVEVDESRRVRRLAARHERYGKSREAAAAWAHGPDEHNARLVAPGRDIADVIVRGH
ncbi:MAG: nucleoside/nucleotide kinase family protein [Jiangellales bacterium]